MGVITRLFIPVFRNFKVEPFCVCRTACVFLSLLLFLISDGLFAAGEDKNIQALKALVSIDQDHIQENLPFVLTILVNYSEPLEVDIMLPDFGEECTLDRLRSAIHIMRGAGEDAERWTEIELLITPKVAGKIKIDPFMISNPYETIWTAAIELNVHPEEQGLSPVLIWDGAKSIRQGKNAMAYLRIGAWDSGRPYPRDLPIRITAPKNAIIEQLDLSSDDKYAGIVFRIRITALEGKEIRLDEYRFNYEEWKMVVPALRIRILPEIREIAASDNAGPQDGNEFLREGEISGGKGRASLLYNEGQNTGSLEQKPIFPKEGSTAGILVSLSGKYFRETLESARGLWNDAHYAAALALLRAGERDSIAGSQFALLRKDCEKALGMPVMGNEVQRMPVFFGGAAGIALFFILIRIGFFILKRTVGCKGAKDDLVLFPWKSTGCAALVIVICGLVLIGRITEDGKSAVIQESPFYTVPEDAGGMAGLFEEGTPVRIVTKSSAWAYVEGESGNAGWVPEDKLVLY